MKYVYALVPEKKHTWEDIIIFIEEELAIQASIINIDSRVEIFEKSESGGFIPTLNYFKCGIYITLYN